MKARCEKIELLDKQRREIIAMEGKLVFENQEERNATAEIKADWPSAFRWEAEFVHPETKGKVRTTLSVQVDQGWMQLASAPSSDLGLPKVEEVKIEIYGHWLMTLYPLKDKTFTLTMLKDNKVGDEDVAVVKASLRFRPDVYLSFSKKSGHLLKVAYKAREEGIELRKEHLLSDYKEFDGIKLPTRLIDNWQIGAQPAVKKAEWTITGYKFVDSFPAETFEKPKK